MDLSWVVALQTHKLNYSPLLLDEYTQLNAIFSHWTLALSGEELYVA
jgi:hypothetical protein